MDVTFIVNMRAGNYKGRRMWHYIQKQLIIPFTVHETKYQGHARDLVQQIALYEGKQLVIIIGGDGTMHEAVNGAKYCSNVILGYVRAGSGNDFARTFTFFKDAQAIEHYVLGAGTTVVDCGSIRFNGNESKNFINNFGIGFDGYVSRLANESSIKKVFNKVGLGKLSYAYFVALALIQFKPFTLKIEQREFKNVWFATVSNQPYFGGGMNLSPTSKVDDGELEVTIVNNLPRLKFLLLFLTVFAAKHTKYKAVTQFSVKDTILTVDKLVPLHTDGEHNMLTERIVHCTVEPQSITIAK